MAEYVEVLPEVVDLQLLQDLKDELLELREGRKFDGERAAFDTDDGKEVSERSLTLAIDKLRARVKPVGAYLSLRDHGEELTVLVRWNYRSAERTVTITAEDDELARQYRDAVQAVKQRYGMHDGTGRRSRKGVRVWLARFWRDLLVSALATAIVTTTLTLWSALSR